jgi:uncharacterized protein (TIGR00251 family)
MSRISVQVTARASTNSVEALADGALRVRVTAAPVDGAANEAVVRVLAEALSVAPSRIRIVSGAAARTKVVEVSGMTPDRLTPRLRGLRP